MRSYNKLILFNFILFSPFSLSLSPIDCGRSSKKNNKMPSECKVSLPDNEIHEFYEDPSHKKRGDDNRIKQYEK